MKFRQKLYSEADKSLFIGFICVLEGWKTKCKNLHWAAPKKNIHVYLDELLDVVSTYQDALAEGYMGVIGKMGPSDIHPVLCNVENAMDLIEEMQKETMKFYGRLPEGFEWKGITGETESFIQSINKYHYLTSLCDL